MSRLIATAPAPVPEAMEVLNAVVERRQKLEANAAKLRGLADPADSTAERIALLHVAEWRLRVVLDVMPPSFSPEFDAAVARQAARFDYEEAQRYDAPSGAGESVEAWRG